MYTPSLPYRRLVKFANGIWDEEIKTFYPFKSSSSTLSSKKGISYYIESLSTNIAVSGISAASTAYWTLRFGGVASNVCLTRSPQLTQATDFVSGSTSMIVGQLCDPNGEITLSASLGGGSVVYAEIPIDGAGMPVVVQ